MRTNISRIKFRLTRLEDRTAPAVFKVTNTADGGSGSLRAAIASANSSPGADSIAFDASFSSATKTITLTTGELAITDSLTIAGPASNKLTVSGNSVNRVFNLAAGTTCRFSGLTISNGFVNGRGAGLLNAGDLSLDNVIVSNNRANWMMLTGSGGGVSNSGTMTVQNCTFTGNVAVREPSGGGGYGGAIYNTGTLTITASTLAGNTGAAQGGGLSNVGTATVTDSTFSANNGGFDGGAIGNQGVLTLSNSTLAGNSAGGGGGLFTGTFSQGGSTGIATTMTNCTISGNTAYNSISSVGSGGGVTHHGGTFSLSNSIVAGNSDTYGYAPDLFGAVSSLGYNLFGDTKNGSGFVATDVVNVNAKLGALQSNGGPTLTMIPAKNSPVLNAGDPAATGAFDQRGTGYARISGGRIDIGAVESPFPARVQSLVINGGVAQRSRVTSIQVNFDSAVTLPANPANAFELKRQSDGATVVLNASASGNAVNLGFTGGPVNYGSLADGRYTLKILANQVVNFDGNGDGTAGDDYTLTGTPANGLFRLFGDADGNGTVDLNDFAQLRSAYGNTSSVFSFDGIGTVDLADFAQFRSRYGMAI